MDALFFNCFDNHSLYVASTLNSLLECINIVYLTLYSMLRSIMLELHLTLLLHALHNK